MDIYMLQGTGISDVNTLRPNQNGRHFEEDNLQVHFTEWKCMNYD